MAGQTGNNLPLRVTNTLVPPGDRPLRAHSHGWFEIVLFKAGAGVYTTRRTRHVIHTGDVFVFSGHEMHCITRVEAEPPMHLMNIHFEPRFLWGEGVDCLFDPDESLCFRHGADFPNKLPENPALPAFRENMLTLERELAEKRTGYALMARLLVETLFLSLLRDFDYARGLPEPGEDPRDDALRRALAYVNRHYTEELTLADAAAAAGLSPNYLSAVFHRVMGLTLWDYVLSRRLDRAMRLLETGDDTMWEIAARCGFGSTANFNKAFRSRLGVSPREYRKSPGHI